MKLVIIILIIMLVLAIFVVIGFVVLFFNVFPPSDAPTEDGNQQQVQKTTNIR